MAEPGAPNDLGLPRSSDPTPVTPTPPPTDARGFAPGPARFRRLVASQYRRAVEDLLGPEAAQATTPPPDPSLNGLKGIAASELALSAVDIAAYERSALSATAAAIAVGAVGPRFGDCADDTSSCLRLRTRRILDRAFRRPARQSEVERYVLLGERIAAVDDAPDSALRTILTAVLQSPAFLYRTEIGEPEPGRPDVRRLAGFELANRLSFFLTDGPPDSALRTAALHGRLREPEVLAAEARRLLTTAAAKTALIAFYDEYLRLGELPDLVKDTVQFPGADRGLFADMREETHRLIADIVWQRQDDIREMFRAPYTYANAPLARLYGLDEDRSMSPDGWHRYELPAESRRAGYLGQASFLALTSHHVSSSPTLRGKFVQEVLLCRAIPAPPPEVDTTLPEPGPGQALMTARQKVELHLSIPSCAGCHSAMDPIGLGLENFDAIGAYRATENRMPIDASSAFNDVPFEGAAELGTILAQSDRAAYCVVRNLFRHATGHVEQTWEEPSLRTVDAAFAAGGYRLQSAMLALVLSEAFQLVRAP